MAKLSWVSTNPTSGSGNGTLSVTASKNTGRVRAGNLSIAGSGVSKSVYITQKAVPIDFRITEDPADTNYSNQLVSVSSPNWNNPYNDTVQYYLKRISETWPLEDRCAIKVNNINAITKMEWREGYMFANPVKSNSFITFDLTIPSNVPVGYIDELTLTLSNGVLFTIMFDWGGNA